MTEDKFALLGLERRYAVDRDDLDRRYRDLTRQVHPDRFATATARQRTESLLKSTALNDAYRVLKDPVRRAEHLLELGGEALSEKDKVDQEFLMEIMELREALGEADAAGRETLLADVRGRSEAAMTKVAELFAGGAPLTDVKREMIAHRYYRRFVEETEPGEH
jgi:molecular chaperone HscB